MRRTIGKGIRHEKKYLEVPVKNTDIFNDQISFPWQ